MCFRACDSGARVTATQTQEPLQRSRKQEAEEKAATKLAERELAKRLRAEAKAEAQKAAKEEGAKATKKPRIAADETLSTAYTCYWAPHEIKLFMRCAGAPSGLHLTGGNAKRMSHSKLKAGDLYFPVTIKNGHMLVLGCLEVTSINPAAALTAVQYDEWHTRHCLEKITNCYAPRFLLEVRQRSDWSSQGFGVPAPQLLRWIKPDGYERAFKEITPGYMQQALNGVYRLSDASSDLLRALCVS